MLLTGLVVGLVDNSIVQYCSPRESEGVCFYQRWFVCMSVTMITKKIVDRFVPNFMVPREKGKTKFVFHYDR